jgi:hypothetical protein
LAASMLGGPEQRVFTPSDIESILNGLSSTLGNAWLWTLLVLILSRFKKKNLRGIQLLLSGRQTLDPPKKSMNAQHLAP